MKPLTKSDVIDYLEKRILQANQSWEVNLFLELKNHFSNTYTDAPPEKKPVPFRRAGGFKSTEYRYYFHGFYQYKEEARGIIEHIETGELYSSRIHNLKLEPIPDIRPGTERGDNTNDV